MKYNNPNTDGAVVNFQERYDNFIVGEYITSKHRHDFYNVTPVTGEVFYESVSSTKEDVELAVDAAHKAKDSWGKTSLTERANMLNKIADRIEENLEMLAVAETWDNGKP